MAVEQNETKELMVLIHNLTELAERNTVCASILAKWGIDKETENYANAAVKNYRDAVGLKMILQTQCGVHLLTSDAPGQAA